MPDLLATAVELHQSGRFEEAEATYRRVLRDEPSNSEALHLLGLLAHQVGDNQAAARLIGRAIEVEGRRALYHFNLGVVLAASGDTAAAEGAYRNALAVDPSHADAHNNVGLLLQDKGEHGEALEAFRRAVRHNPKHAEAQVNLGRALQERGDSGEALASFETALALDQRLPEAHFGKGRSLELLDRWAEAEAAYRAALRLRPEFPEAQNNLGSALLAQGKYDDAKAAFHRLFEERRGAVVGAAEPLLNAPPQSAAGTADPPRATRFLLFDRLQQLEHLLGKGLIDPSFESLVERYRTALGQFEAADGPDWKRPLSPSQMAQIGGFFDKVIRFADAPRLQGPAVNADLDCRDIEEAYLSASAPMIWFDDFLSPEALENLRRFCLESTVYFGADPAGYVSSYLPDGFNCSLMYQLAEELKQRFPRVIGSHHLSNMWSYRHVAEGGGVKAHTDLAAVTFNFWLTPDAANLDPDSGGLVVYTREEPMDWDWMDINKRKNAPDVRRRIEAFLASSEEVVIPYRENRAVLFHSNLFHKSDALRFKEGFETRRINISLLFGHRGDCDPAGGARPGSR